MTFQPVIPSGGVVGWRFLQRTYEAQIDSFSQSGVNQRETQYFLENISNVLTAEDLVSDRRLLQVALGAFGLEEDLDNRFFIQKILQDGT
ncbi:MAG: flagellar protein, partial [Pseudomonadota bacterium]